MRFLEILRICLVLRITIRVLYVQKVMRKKKNIRYKPINLFILIALFDTSRLFRKIQDQMVVENILDEYEQYLKPIRSVIKPTYKSNGTQNS